MNMKTYPNEVLKAEPWKVVETTDPGWVLVEREVTVRERFLNKTHAAWFAPSLVDTLNEHLAGENQKRAKATVDDDGFCHCTEETMTVLVGQRKCCADCNLPVREKVIIQPRVEGELPIGPNPCLTCGGEYGEHEPGCLGN